MVTMTQAKTAPTPRARAALWATGALICGLALIPAVARAQTTVTAHGISTFGELDLPADFPHLPYVNPDAPKGGELSQATFGSFNSLNPYSIKGVAAAGSTVMLESILTGSADEIGASYCLMCTTMEYPEDRSWVIFNLRDDIRFSDGTPLTSEDVIFSYQTFLSKGLSDFRTVLSAQVESAEALGPYTVKYTFKPGQPFRDLPETMGSLPILSKAYYTANAMDLEESSVIPHLGSGPYAFDKMDIGRSVSYRRNPDYWGQDLPINIGQNNFDTLRFEYFGDPNAAFEGFKAGIYNFRRENSSKQWATQYDFSAVTSGAVVQQTLLSGEKGTGQAFIFNLRREKWQDPRVREAVRLMFNFEWTNKTLFYGLYARINSVWENTDMAATGTPGPEETAILQPLVDEGLLPATILTDEAVMAPVSGTDRQLDRRNLRAASTLLDEAGWDVGDDGKRRNAAGQPLTIEFLNDNPTFERVIAPYVENLIALGIDARLTIVDGAQFEQRTRNPSYDFDIITDNARSSYIPGPDLLQYYGSATADISAFNVMGLKSPAVDALIKTVMAAESREGLTTATRALDRVLRAEGFWVPQWFNNDYWVAYYDQFEHPETLPRYALGETSFWWYNAEKGAALKASGALK